MNGFTEGSTFVPSGIFRKISPNFCIPAPSKLDFPVRLLTRACYRVLYVAAVGAEASVVPSRACQEEGFATAPAQTVSDRCGKRRPRNLPIAFVYAQTGWQTFRKFLGILRG